MVQELRRDRDSKRAVITIYEPREALVPDNIDVACTLGLQFFVRDGALHCQSYMRANDAFVGVVSDVFSFTGMQEVMARQLGLEVGGLTHSVGSYHLYLNDADRAERVLTEARGMTNPADAFPAMPEGDSWPQIHAVIDYMDGLHGCSSPSALARPEAMGLSDYWRDVATIFYLHRQHALSAAVDRKLLETLPHLYQTLLAQRWPDVFGLPGR
ncbi:thymidylate synthase [Micromonospora sp. ALFpr18c]|uniref:thymidylate synthase n=1 Tax=unclassified Micromonospora TaxID=2617518 RepID=UPI001788B724|nr:thymidylate synthase [Micromonospora sp. ALFpr18c]